MVFRNKNGNSQRPTFSNTSPGFKLLNSIYGFQLYFLPRENGRKITSSRLQSSLFLTLGSLFNSVTFTNLLLINFVPSPSTFFNSVADSFFFFFIYFARRHGSRSYFQKRKVCGFQLFIDPLFLKEILRKEGKKQKVRLRANVLISLEKLNEK